VVSTSVSHVLEIPDLQAVALRALLARLHDPTSSLQ
jgi:hypothetical protein